MGSVLLLQSLCLISLSFTHAVMLDILNPQYVSGVRQLLFQFYMVTFGILAVIVALFLPSFIYIGQGIIRELAELPAQLKSFRVQDVKCFCCTNHHREPNTGETLPCDRVLVHRMLARWFGKTSDEDDFAYVERFNKLVREELSIVVLSDGTLRFSDAVKVAWSVTIPWISDFIPWWADSDLTGFLVEDWESLGKSWECVLFFMDLFVLLRFFLVPLVSSRLHALELQRNCDAGMDVHVRDPLEAVLGLLGQGAQVYSDGSTRSCITWLRHSHLASLQVVVCHDLRQNVSLYHSGIHLLYSWLYPLTHVKIAIFVRETDDRIWENSISRQTQVSLVQVLIQDTTQEKMVPECADIF